MRRANLYVPTHSDANLDLDQLRPGARPPNPFVGRPMGTEDAAIQATAPIWYMTPNDRQMGGRMGTASELFNGARIVFQK